MQELNELILDLKSTLEFTERLRFDRLVESSKETIRDTIKALLKDIKEDMDINAGLYKL